MTPTAKLVWMIAMFAVALGLVVLSAAIHRAGPLFGAWAPLVAVPWILSRPEPERGRSTARPEDS